MTKLEALLIKQRLERDILYLNQQVDIFDLHSKGENNNMVDPDVAKMISDLDVASNAIAARFAKLIAGATGLNQETKDAMNAEVAKIQALGADPANPIPTPV